MPLSATLAPVADLLRAVDAHVSTLEAAEQDTLKGAEPASLADNDDVLLSSQRTTRLAALGAQLSHTVVQLTLLFNSFSRGESSAAESAGPLRRLCNEALQHANMIVRLTLGARTALDGLTYTRIVQRASISVLEALRDLAQAVTSPDASMASVRTGVTWEAAGALRALPADNTAAVQREIDTCVYMLQDALNELRDLSDSIEQSVTFSALSYDAEDGYDDDQDNYGDDGAGDDQDDDQDDNRDRSARPSDRADHSDSRAAVDGADAASPSAHSPVALSPEQRSELLELFRSIITHSRALINAGQLLLRKTSLRIAPLRNPSSTSTSPTLSSEDLAWGDGLVDLSRRLAAASDDLAVAVDPLDPEEARVASLAFTTHAVLLADQGSMRADEATKQWLARCTQKIAEDTQALMKDADRWDGQDDKESEEVDTAPQR